MLLNENIDMMDALNSTLPQVIFYVAFSFLIPNLNIHNEYTYIYVKMYIVLNLGITKPMYDRYFCLYEQWKVRCEYVNNNDKQFITKKITI